MKTPTNQIPFCLNLVILMSVSFQLNCHLLFFYFFFWHFGVIFWDVRTEFARYKPFFAFSSHKNFIVNMSCFGHILRVIAYNLQLVLHENNLLGLQKLYFAVNTCYPPAIFPCTVPIQLVLYKRN